MNPQVGVGGILEFLLYVGQAKRTLRTGWVLRGVEKVESVADHMYRMSIMALLLPNIDEQAKVRCMKLSLVHDLAESVVGDLTHFDQVSKDEKHRRENDAMLHLTSLLPAETGRDLFELFKEYSEQQTNEARLVKDLDIFDMLLQDEHFEYDWYENVERRCVLAHEYERLQKEEGFLEDFFAGSAEKVKSAEVRPWLDQLLACRSSGEAFHLPSDSNLKTILKDLVYDEHGTFLSNLPSSVLREKSDRLISSSRPE